LEILLIVSQVNKLYGDSSESDDGEEKRATTKKSETDGRDIAVRRKNVLIREVSEYGTIGKHEGQGDQYGRVSGLQQRRTKQAKQDV